MAENGGPDGRHLRVVPHCNVIPVTFTEPPTTIESSPDDACYVITKREVCPCQDPECRQVEILGVADDEEMAAALIEDYVTVKNAELDEKMRGRSAEERVLWARRILRVVDPGLTAVDIRGDKVVAERRPYGDWKEAG